MKKFLAVALVVLAAFSVTTSAQAATAGQRNALNSAQSYLSLTALSKSALVDQLKYDNFSNSDARWAVAHVRVSWYAQAVKSARSYLQVTSLSRQSLREQLEYDGFTSAQAAYGVKKAYR